MNFTGRLKVIFKKMTQEQLSPLEQETLRIQKKAAELAAPYIEALKENSKSSGDTGTYTVNNAWVVKPHRKSKAKLSL